MVSWVFAVAASYLVFVSLRVEVPLSVILVTTTIVAAIKSIPIGVPFEMGLPEITMSGLFSLLSPSVTLEIALTGTLLIRVLTLWMRFFIGFAAQQWLEIRPIKRPLLNPSMTDLEKT